MQRMLGQQDCLAVEVTRGATVESVHRIHAAVVDAGGDLLASWGDPDRLVFPRSGIKSMQALPLVESGAADAYRLSVEELAISGASHQAEAMHVDTVARWLARIDCRVSDLGCGVHPPGHPDCAAELLRSGHAPSAIHNNCSGKHTGMLCTARHLGDDVAGYTEYDHPVQARVRLALSEMTDWDMETAPWDRDGCSIPTLAAPLSAWARGMARMADSSALGPVRGEAARRIVSAIMARPLMIGGTRQWDSQMMARLDGKLLAKTGAEGVACVALPGRGIGFVLKVEDGAVRALPLAVAGILKALGEIDDVDAAAGHQHTVLSNWNRHEVGRIRLASR